MIMIAVVVVRPLNKPLAERRCHPDRVCDYDPRALCLPVCNLLALSLPECVELLVESLTLTLKIRGCCRLLPVIGEQPSPLAAELLCVASVRCGAVTAVCESLVDDATTVSDRRRRQRCGEI
jgi:hypothetical protein